MNAAAWRSPADLRGEAAPSTAVRDMIRTEGNLHPHYQVIALSEDRIWVVDLPNGTNLVIPIAGHRKI